MLLTQINHLNAEKDECINDCFDAAQACEWCADQCAEKGEGMAECIRLCRDVADLTTMHARFMARKSTFDSELAEAYALSARSAPRSVRGTATTTVSSVPTC